MVKRQTLNWRVKALSDAHEVAEWVEARRFSSVANGGDDE